MQQSFTKPTKRKFLFSGAIPIYPRPPTLAMPVCILPPPPPAQRACILPPNFPPRQRANMHLALSFAPWRCQHASCPRLTLRHCQAVPRQCHGNAAVSHCGAMAEPWQCHSSARQCHSVPWHCRGSALSRHWQKMHEEDEDADLTS